MLNRFIPGLITICLSATTLIAQTPSSLLLVLNKGDNSLAIVDPATRQVIARALAGNDPHEVIASADGKLAFISNYGPGHTLSVVDLVTQKALPAVELAPLTSPHGLAQIAGKIYFTAEANKVIGRYDPASQKIDWLLGLGQERTHMIVVSKDAKRIFTSNVNSDTISLIEFHANQNPRSPGAPPPLGSKRPSDQPYGQPRPPAFGRRGPPPGGPGGNNWEITNLAVGKGPEGFDLSPDEKELWAANSHDGTVSIIDVEKKSVVQTIRDDVRAANRLKFTPDGKLVFVSDLVGDKLLILDAVTRKEIKRLDLGGGSAGILMEPGGLHAYVAVGSANGLAVIDLKTLEVTAHIQSGPGPDGLAWVTRN